MIHYNWIGEVPADDVEVLQRYIECKLVSNTSGRRGTLIDLPSHNRYSIRVVNDPEHSYVTVTRG